MPLLIFHFLTTAVLTFLRSGLKLLNENAVEMTPKYRRTEAQSWPNGSRKNNNT